MKRPWRILIAKIGLDGHDRGAKVIARYFRDSGFEVIYSGLHQSVEQIAKTAVEEDVDCIGVSLLSGAHDRLIPKLVSTLKTYEAEDILLICGGIIPDEDIPGLKNLGVHEVFQPGASLETIVSEVSRALDVLEVKVEGDKPTGS